MPSTNQRAPREALERTLEAFDAFQHRMMSVHAPDFAALDLTMAQAKLLYVVSAAGELSMSEIAHRLGISISTASGAVDHLVTLAFLARSDDPANRRQVRVEATARGQETLDQLRELGTRQLRSLLSVLTDAELAVVDRSIRIMSRAADAVVDAPADPSRSTE